VEEEDFRRAKPDAQEMHASSRRARVDEANILRACSRQLCEDF
jgi:hypothetical protein